MKKIIVLLLILASPLFAEKGTSNFKKVFTQEEKQIFLDSMNKYRLAKGLKKVQYSIDAEKFAKIRTQTIYNHLKGLDSSEFVNNYKSHLHFGSYNEYLEFSTKLALYGSYSITLAFENVIFIPRKEVVDLSSTCFEGWKNSPAHWEAMMSESINHMSLIIDNNELGIVATLFLFRKFNKIKK